MHPGSAAGLGIGRYLQAFQCLAGDVGSFDDLIESGLAARVQVDDAPGGIIGLFHRAAPGIDIDAAERGHVQQRGGSVRHQEVLVAAKAVRVTRQTIRLFILTVRAVFYAVVLFLILAGLYILLTKPVPRPPHPVPLRSFTSIRDTAAAGSAAAPRTAPGR